MELRKPKGRPKGSIWRSFGMHLKAESRRELKRRSCGNPSFYYVKRMIFEVRRALEGTWRALATQFEGIWSPFGVQVALGVLLGRPRGRSKGQKGAQGARQGGTGGAQGPSWRISSRGGPSVLGRPEASWQNILVRYYIILYYIILYYIIL